MSIAAIFAQVMERKDAVQDKVLVDHLSQICASAVRESLVNVFGDKFDIFVENFEKSFRSTLMTLQLISKSTKTSGGGNRRPVRRKYSSEGAAAAVSSSNRIANSAGDFGSEESWSETLSQASSRDEQASSHEGVPDSTRIDLRNQQLIIHDRQIIEQLGIVSPNQRSREFDSSDNRTAFSTLERSVMEQARSNDLKTFEMSLIMKRLQLKERLLELSSYSNFLERWKLSLGFSKTSFKLEKFKTQLEDTRHAELLKRCIDCLVSGLFIMLASIAYGVSVFSHQRITDVTAACSSTSESKSWWMPKTMSSINSGMQILKCQFQVLTRLLAGGILVLLIAYLLLQRSATANQSMPFTFLVLLLGLLCGISGKLCIDTLGGNGNCWLSLWWTFCSVHIFSNVWTSALFAILYGPITVAEKTKRDPHFPYWLRRFLFYTNSAFILPLLCGFLPFASLGEWKGHFCSLFLHHLLTIDD